MKKVLEVNVDDLYSGGVFSLVRNVVFQIIKRYKNRYRCYRTFCK